MKSRQSGFTLVEIAIVLVIVGLLLAGVLKGQELINSGKVKNLAADFRGIATAYYGYMDKFRAVAGDDSAAQTHVGTQTGGVWNTTNGNGDGAIGGNWNATTGESFVFWQHVRLANLMAGTTTTTDANYVPTNAEGGKIGITSTNPDSTSGSNFKGSFYVCSAVNGNLAKQIDSTMDDGVSNTGSVRIFASTLGASDTPIAQGSVADGTAYVVCVAN